MRAVVQTVSRASVTVEDEVVGAITDGLLVLVGDVQQARLVEEIAHQLHSDRQAVHEPARQAHRRAAREIGRDGVDVVQVHRHRVVHLRVQLERDVRRGRPEDEVALLEDLAEEGHVLPQKILEWRQFSKLRSTYTDALPAHILPDTGRVHTSYALAATPTGRLSSSEPKLQKIPIRTEARRKIRRAFVAEPGLKLVSAE